MDLVKRLNRPKSIVALFIIIITLFIFIKLLYPFLVSSPYFAESTHHITSSRTTKELLPSVIGWKQHAYAGFPHNQFEPPFFSLLVGFLSIFLPLEFAYKLIIIISTLLVPLLLYYWARSQKLSRFQALFAMLLSVIVLSLPSTLFSRGGEIGWFFFDTFNNGLMPACLALTLALVYMILINKVEEKLNVIFLTLLLAAIILTHIPTAIVIIVYLLSTIYYQRLHKSNIRLPVFHLLLSLGLSIWWILPYLSRVKFTENMSFYLTSTDILLPFFIVIIFGIYYVIKRNQQILQLMIFITSLAFTVAILQIVFNFGSYRLFLWFYLAGAIIVSSIVKYEIRYAYIFLIIAIIIIHSYMVFLPKSVIEPSSIFAYPDKRTIVISSNNVAANTFVPYLFSNTGAYIVNGPSPKSSKNSVMVNALYEMIAPNHGISGARTNVSYVHSLKINETREYILGILQYLGISQIITDVESSRINYSEKRHVLSLDSHSGSVMIRFEDKHFSLPRTVRNIALFNAYNNQVSVYLIRELIQDYGTITYVHTNQSLDSFYYKGNILKDRFIWCDDNEFYFLEKILYPSYDVYKVYIYDKKQIYDFSGLRLQCNETRTFPQSTNKTLAFRRFEGEQIIQLELNESFHYGLRDQNYLQIPYYLYTFNDTPLIEPLKSEPIKVNSWEFNQLNSNIKDFINATNGFKDHFIMSAGDFRINPDATVRDIDIQDERVEFFIDSADATPVVLKITYFPNWKAYADGNEIPIYEISPHFMMIYAKGRIVLEYGRGFADILGIVISLLSLLILGRFAFWLIRAR